MPKSKSAEFYGFFSVSEKFNTWLVPPSWRLSANSLKRPLGYRFTRSLSLYRWHPDAARRERGTRYRPAEEEDAKMIAVDRKSNFSTRLARILWADRGFF
jgi:hypothetical protein